MVGLDIISVEEANGAIEPSTILLLLGLMLILSHLESKVAGRLICDVQTKICIFLQGLIGPIENLLLYRCSSARSLLCRVCFAAGILGATIMNDGL